MRLRIFALIFLVMCGLGIYHIVINDLQTTLALAAVAGGIGMGLIIGRIYNVVWHEETE